MSYVNVKYTLELDATVKLDRLKFANIAINYKADKKATGYSGKVNKAFADDVLLINLLMSGPAGAWKLEVFVRELDENDEETGDWKPLNGNGKDYFENDISERNALYGNYKINWVP